MEYLNHDITMEVAPGTFPLSTDSMLLSGFVKLPKNASVLDLGSGCGTLGLLLCSNDANCSVTGIEINQAAHDAAVANISQNHLSHRLTSVCADLRNICSIVSAGSFSCCVSNPPYFSGGPTSKSNATARRDDCCTTKELFTAAAWALRYGGEFFLVHRPEKLAHLCATASGLGLEPKRLCLVRHNQEKPVSLVLLACKKGGKPGLTWEEICLFHPDGSPTNTYKKLYHL